MADDIFSTSDLEKEVTSAGKTINDLTKQIESFGKVNTSLKDQILSDTEIKSNIKFFSELRTNFVTNASAWKSNQKSLEQNTSSLSNLDTLLNDISSDTILTSKELSTLNIEMSSITK